MKKTTLQEQVLHDVSIKGMRSEYEPTDADIRIERFRQRIQGEDIDPEKVIDRIWRISEFINNDGMDGYKDSPRKELKKLRNKIKRKGIKCIMREENDDE